MWLWKLLPSVIANYSLSFQMLPLTGMEYQSLALLEKLIEGCGLQTDEETEALRTSGTCPLFHSQEEADCRFGAQRVLFLVYTASLMLLVSPGATSSFGLQNLHGQALGSDLFLSSATKE